MAATVSEGGATLMAVGRRNKEGETTGTSANMSVSSFKAPLIYTCRAEAARDSVRKDIPPDHDAGGFWDGPFHWGIWDRGGTLTPAAIMTQQTLCLRGKLMCRLQIPGAPLLLCLMWTWRLQTTGAHGQHVLNYCCASEEEGLDDLSQIRVQIQDIENQGDMANRITDPDTGSQIPLEGPKRNTGDRREGPDRNNLAPGSSSPQTDPGCG
jgi:hypothetical protein